MVGLFSKSQKVKTGAELAEEGLNQIAMAIENKVITLEQGRVFSDIYAHGDRPSGVIRISYVMFSPSVANLVIARCVILFDRVSNDIPIFQIDWAVLPSYRRKGVGISIAAKALTEFTRGMKGNFDGSIAIEAVVDDSNEASKKIAASLLGGKETQTNDPNGTVVHSYLRVFPM